MRNKIFTFVLSMLITAAAFASTNPVNDVKIIDAKSVSVSIEVGQENIFKVADFNEINETLVFETLEDISFIQIFNQEGGLEYQLPVMSNKVMIGKSMMGSGEYKIGFMIKGLNNIQFTHVNVK